MSVIELREGNCRNCYKCIRGCPVKAIEFKDGRAAVIEKECVLCGACIATCPQNAKHIRSELDAAKALLRSGRPVYATVAPSWSGYFDTSDFASLTASLCALGFAGVEETAIGAYEASREYAALLEQGKMKNVIVTACASAVMLVEKHYPALIPYLAPVSSPMMAHARLMREAYGDIAVVFIGPCFSKKQEAKDPLSGELCDCVLTFDELETWLDEAGQSLRSQEANASAAEADTAERSHAVGTSHPVSRLYPTPTGIIKTIDPDVFGSSCYKPVAVDGLERCIELFDAMVNDQLEGLFVEANICSGSCVGGPVMRLHGKVPIITSGYISDEKQPQDEHPAASSLLTLEHPRVFADRSVRYPMPTEEQIKAILAKTGKFTPEQELNCGSCGYASCRDKAIAVFQGKADINMCLPFFRERAESISNTILANSPNAIIALDSDRLIQDLNKTAEQMFEITRGDAVGFPLPMFEEDSLFEQARKEGKPADKKVVLMDYGIVVEETVVYIDNHDMYVAFIKDITREEADARAMKDMREHTIETAQAVIDKQMRVAQEIASLLGETTAETKVALTNLKKSMAEKAGR